MKYIIEIEDKPNIDTFDKSKYYKCKQVPYWYVSENIKNKLTPYTEPDRKAIEDEVWGFVRIITDMTECERKECFGCSTCDLDEYMTYQDAKTKYEAWLKQKDEIRVGDEIYSDGDFEISIVMETYGDGSVSVYTKSGCIEHWYNEVHNLKKTGRHFDEVEELLKKVRDADEN